MTSGASLRDQLSELIRKGPLTDVFNAEEAWAVSYAIGQHANEINESPYGALCGRLQLIVADQLALAVSRLFERPKRYPTRSIPAVLDFLHQHASTLEVVEPEPLQHGLAKWNNSPDIKAGVNQSQTLRLVEFLSGYLPSSDLVMECTASKSFHKVRIRRNKRIAHNEAYEISSEEKPTWKDLIDLIHLAKDIISPVSIGYVGLMICWPSGEFVMESEARANAIRLLDMLKAAGVITRATVAWKGI